MYDFRSSAPQVPDEIRKVTDPVLHAFHVGLDVYAKALEERGYEARNAKFIALRPYWDQRFKELLALSDMEDPAVWYAIGVWYGIFKRREDGGKEKSAAWFLKAAEARHVDAMLRTAIPLKRLESPEGYEAACAWLRKAADLGRVSAMISLGFMYRDGQGVPWDGPKALEWFSKAVDLGSSYAMMKMAQIYAWSECRNPFLAVIWFKRAIDAGRTDCIQELAKLYDDKDTDIYDPEEAVKWYHRAAKDDRDTPYPTTLRAMMALAQHAFDGLGVERDVEEAKRWLQKVILSEHDYEHVREEARKMLSKMQHGTVKAPNRKRKETSQKKRVGRASSKEHSVRGRSG